MRLDKWPEYRIYVLVLLCIVGLYMLVDWFYMKCGIENTGLISFVTTVITIIALTMTRKGLKEPEDDGKDNSNREV